MRLAQQIILMQKAAVVPYWQKVRDLQPADLVQYIRLNDASGTQATDYSGANRHGLYVNGPTLANAAGPDGVLVPYFDGSNQCVDLDNPFGTLTNVIAPPAQGSIMIWGRVPDQATWEDGTIDLLVSIGYNGSNECHIKKGNVATDWGISFRRSPNASQVPIDHFDYEPLGWMMCGLTWDDTAGEMRAYIYDAVGGFVNLGVAAYETDYAGLDYRASFIGAFLASGASPFKGWLAHFAFWKTVLTETKYRTLATV